MMTLLYSRHRWLSKFIIIFMLFFFASLAYAADTDSGDNNRDIYWVTVCNVIFTLGLLGTVVFIISNNPLEKNHKELINIIHQTLKVGPKKVLPLM